MPDFDQYQSPFTWRYASPAMRQVWSESHKRLLWRKIWVALARAEMAFELVTPAQVADLEAHSGQVDIPRALQIEAEIHHDLMAELRAYAEQCPLGGAILHLGATSTDIEDNTDALRIRQSMDLVLDKLGKVLLVLADRIRSTALLTVMAFTHLQPAEPTTLGYRFSGYAQDLLESWNALRNLREQIRGKGLKGAVGSAAAYTDLVGAANLDTLEAAFSRELELPFFPITTQTYPRKQDYDVISALAGIGAALYKLAFDLRLLQSPPLGELSEPFGKLQVGSSAMPFKRNPINAEKVDSLARQLAALPAIAWQNAAHSLLERTLDDSANRRSLLPEAFLIMDELLITSRRILEGCVINQAAIKRNLGIYAPFAAIERLLMAAVKRGANRQDLHEVFRVHALAAWEQVQNGNPNPLLDSLKQDPVILRWLAPAEFDSLTRVDEYTGLAGDRALWLAKKIREEV